MAFPSRSIPASPPTGSGGDVEVHEHWKVIIESPSGLPCRDDLRTQARRAETAALVSVLNQRNAVDRLQRVCLISFEVRSTTNPARRPVHPAWST